MFKQNSKFNMNDKLKFVFKQRIVHRLYINQVVALFLTLFYRSLHSLIIFDFSLLFN